MTDKILEADVTIRLTRRECAGMAAIGTWCARAADVLGPAHPESLPMAEGLLAMHRILEAAREAMLTPTMDPRKTAERDQAGAASTEAMQSMIMVAKLAAVMRELDEPEASKDGEP